MEQLIVPELLTCALLSAASIMRLGLQVAVSFPEGTRASLSDLRSRKVSKRLPQSPTTQSAKKHMLYSANSLACALRSVIRYSMKIDYDDVGFKFCECA